MDRLKYSLKSQKPESFTWEKKRLPAPTDNTIKFGSVPVAKTNGAIIPAEVNPATVAEPTATRIAAAISQPSNNGGSANPLSISASALLMPPSAKTYFKAPAPATINTHHHGDHTAGNIAFKGIVPHVLAHANSLTNQKAAAAKNKSEDKQLYPDLTYTDTWSEKIGKEKISLHYFGAGHTNGDSFVHFEHANIVHMGDLLFNRRHPFVDKSAGADMGSWIKVLDKAVATFDKKTQFVCGHSGEGYDIVTKPEDLKAFGDYLGNVLKFVEGEIKAGKTKEEIVKTKSIPGSDEWKGDGASRPLEAAYVEITSKTP